MRGECRVIKHWLVNEGIIKEMLFVIRFCRVARKCIINRQARRGNVGTFACEVVRMAFSWLISTEKPYLNLG